MAENNIKALSAAEVNDAFVDVQNGIQYIDKGSSVLKRRSKDSAGNLITQNVLGSVRSALEGSVQLVNGTIKVVLNINLANAVRQILVTRTLGAGAQGFLEVIIDVPGGPAQFGEFTINSSSATDTSTIGFVVLEEQPV